MDSKCRLNKTELKIVHDYLCKFVESDPLVSLHDLLYQMSEEIRTNMQKTFDEKMEITEDIKNYFEKYGINDCNYIYYSMKTYQYHHNYEGRFFDPQLPIAVENVNSIIIKTYTYVLKNKFEDKYAETIIKVFEDVYDKYVKTYEDRYKTYLQVVKEMDIVLNSCKNAQEILNKFGYIETVNKYINQLLSANVKPISCMTKAVENSVDNYIKRRKALDEAKK